MKPTQRDLKRIEAIKHRLDDPDTFPKEKEDLTDDWLAIGMDYLPGLLDEDDVFPNPKYGSILVSQAETMADSASGFAGTLLTKVGICQAETFAKSFMSAPDLIVASPCASSQQTAEPLISRCCGVTVEIWDVGEFVALDAYKTSLQSQNDGPEVAVDCWQVGGLNWGHGVGDKSLVEFIQRVDSALRRLHEAPERWTIVFTHRLFIVAAGLRLGDPGASVDVSFFAKLRDTWNLANAKSHRVDSLNVAALADF
jgi:broad specificity phosphatase PhoE